MNVLLGMLAILVAGVAVLMWGYATRRRTDRIRHDQDTRPPLPGDGPRPKSDGGPGPGAPPKQK